MNEPVWRITLRPAGKLRDAVHPGAPDVREVLRSVHLLHGLPHPAAPPRDVSDPWEHENVTDRTARSVCCLTASVELELTLVDAEVLLGHEGVGSPHHHLADQLRVARGRHQRHDAPVAPAQQGEPLVTQRLENTGEHKRGFIHVPERSRCSQTEVQEHPQI